MKTVIYLDELLLVNFMAAAAMLLAAGLLAGRQCTLPRLLAGAAGAAAASLSLLAPALPEPAAVGWKLASCGAVVGLAYGFPGRRSFARLWGWYLLANLLLGGAVLLPGAQSRNLSLYLPLSPGLLLGCCGGVYLGLQGLMYCCGRGQPGTFAAVLELAEGSCLPVQAFYDTGFSVQEPLLGQPVVLVRYAAVRRRLAAPLQLFMDRYFADASPLPEPQWRLRLVPCRTDPAHRQRLHPAAAGSFQRHRPGGRLGAAAGHRHRPAAGDGVGGQVLLADTHPSSGTSCHLPRSGGVFAPKGGRLSVRSTLPHRQKLP